MYIAFHIVAIGCSIGLVFVKSPQGFMWCTVGFWSSLIIAHLYGAADRIKCGFTDYDKTKLDGIEAGATGNGGVITCRHCDTVWESEFYIEHLNKCEKNPKNMSRQNREAREAGNTMYLCNIDRKDLRKAYEFYPEHSDLSKMACEEARRYIDRRTSADAVSWPIIIYIYSNHELLLGKFFVARETGGDFISTKADGDD